MQHPVCRFGWCAALFTLALIVAPARAQPTLFEDFTLDPKWESYRSYLVPNPLPRTRQDFGLTIFRGQPAVGGWVQRSLTPAWFAKIIPTQSLQDKLSASGTFAVTRDEGGSGLLFGWFNESSRGWRTPNSLVFRIDGNGSKYWVFYEYGTRHWLTGGGGCFEGDRYQTTPTRPFAADGTTHAWSLTYDPEGANGAGLMTFTLDGVAYPQPLSEGHKKDGAEFNRFGLLNLQTTGSGTEAYFSSLVLNGKPINLHDATGWEARGNKTEFADRYLRPYHDFGWKPSADAGGKPGEIGGIIWRDEVPAFYARDVGRLTLEDELVASGKISLKGAGSDSGVYLGWFDSQSKTNKVVSDHEQPPRNILAIMIEGPSRVGHYFRGCYRTSEGTGTLSESGPIIRPDDRVHQWSIRYSPKAANGAGEIAVELDGTVEKLALKPEHRKQGATFDRFGLFNLQVGGHFVELAVDEVHFTSKK